MFHNVAEKESASKPTQLGSWFSKTFSVRKNESFDRLENDVPPIVEDIVSWIQTYGNFHMYPTYP